MSKGLSTPGVRSTPTINGGTKLDAAGKTAYRSRVMRLCYLAADRVELQYDSKELARAMSDPTVADEQDLKHCV
eukprot:9358864-Karenia_brevis.AAC.1